MRSARSHPLPLLAIAGPTGVGKTATAVSLASRMPLEVISADSRQVYRGMDVATGKPSPEERRAVVHHLIDVVDPDDRYQAARFRADAVRLIEDIHARGRLPVVVGGTGLYIRALLRGLDPAPPADPAFRETLELVAAHEGSVALHRRLTEKAPEMARRLHPNDRVRIVRALELVRAGSPVGDAQVRWRGGDSDYRTVYVGLTMPRAALAERLVTRARQMAADGLAQEVRTLLERGYDPSLPAMRGIGYRQFVDAAAGRLAPEEALRLMERDTIRYARRQWTWFTREPDIQWIDVLADGSEDAARRIERMVKDGGLLA
ncbi:MAG: tRNA (adenosine(37)-N6)-dimethylallyltransferase MiaA [Candidatus Rokubacteria bacterium]|nr:tRNA (adenosine(37)-N6)-dimethylallyltransferase MiaA [Candidatus Rokubacteria bacterium]